MAYTITSTLSQMTALLNSISTSASTTLSPSLYFDVEGVNLSRRGSISIIELHYQHPSYPESAHTYLIDIHTLGFLAFSTLTAEGVSLKTVLESPTTAKVFFDVRTDSDALYAQFGIRLAGIIDLQLMEVGSRSRYVVWSLYTLFWATFETLVDFFAVLDLKMLTPYLSTGTRHTLRD